MADPTLRHAKLAVLLRDALAARHDRLDDVDVDAFVVSMELSQQDIDAMLRFLARDTARIHALNLAADKYLRALTPERIWTADPAPLNTCASVGSTSPTLTPDVVEAPLTGCSRNRVKTSSGSRPRAGGCTS